MKRLYALILSLVLFALTPLQLGQSASAAGGDGGASTYAVQLPDLIGDNKQKTHFTMKVSNVSDFVRSDNADIYKYYTTSMSPSGTDSVRIYGTLTHTKPGNLHTDTILVGFCYQLSSGTFMLGSYAKYQGGTVNVYNTTPISHFDRHIAYYGYIRNEIGVGTISGEIVYYSVYN